MRVIETDRLTLEPQTVAHAEEMYVVPPSNRGPHRVMHTMRRSEIPCLVRAYSNRDFDHLVKRWHETNLISYRYVEEHQKHTIDGARKFFRDDVLPACEVWVAERSAQLLGVLALEAPWIRQLAIFPEFQRQGVGSALLRKARERSPVELRLFTFQRNAAARHFYARQGFSPVALGISPAPELEPDVEYRWVA